MEQINITLGTAGHIDHGKTALVKCLTGCETDRLKEEKERGMSIELGFAPCKIADKQVGIVDVPGHENFIRTMVAGAAGMDGVILVVAADDGVMPQTREHLDILTLLGIPHGIVALTKIDRVFSRASRDRSGQRGRVPRGTFLENAPILPALEHHRRGFRSASWNRFGPWSNRSSRGGWTAYFACRWNAAFSISGYGTVVAGIPVAGMAQVGDEVVLCRENVTGRIRRVEVYGQPSEAVKAGQCAALNVGHWDHHAIHRGDTLTIPGYFSPQQWFLCSLRLLPREKLVLKSGAEVKFHTGTAEMAAMFYPVKVMQARCEQGTVPIFAQRKWDCPPLPPCPLWAALVQIKAKSPSWPDRATISSSNVLARADHRRWNHRRGHRRTNQSPSNEAYQDLQDRAEAVLDERRFVEYCIRRAESLAAPRARSPSAARSPATACKESWRNWCSGKSFFPCPRGYVHRDTAAEAGQKILEQVGRIPSPIARESRATGGRTARGTVPSFRAPPRSGGRRNWDCPFGEADGKADRQGRFRRHRCPLEGRGPDCREGPAACAARTPQHVPRRRHQAAGRGRGPVPRSGFSSTRRGRGF